MSNKRKTILSKITEQSDITKEGQETQVVDQEIDKSTADKMANDIFDKIFNEELEKLINSIN